MKHKELLDAYREACERHDKYRVDKLGAEILSLMQAAGPGECEDCGSKIPRGQGLGFSAPDEEWMDKSRSRPVKIVALCHGCIVKRIAPRQGDLENGE